MRTTIFIFNIMLESFIGTTNGRRFALFGGHATLQCFLQKGVIPMTILDVVAVIGIVLTALQIGFSFGRNAKR